MRGGLILLGLTVFGAVAEPRGHHARTGDREIFIGS